MNHKLTLTIDYDKVYTLTYKLDNFKSGTLVTSNLVALLDKIRAELFGLKIICELNNGKEKNRPSS